MQKCQMAKLAKVAKLAKTLSQVMENWILVFCNKGLYVVNVLIAPNNSKNLKQKSLPNKGQALYSN
jgi:hypothetical protein